MSEQRNESSAATRQELIEALRELHAAVWNRGPMMTPDPFPLDHPAMKKAREVLFRV